MSAGSGSRIAAAVALFLAAAVYFVLVELHRPAPTAAVDVYAYFLPNKLHAVASLLHGGRGLLWNPYQSCGEPFFANPAMGLLYPLHLLFLVLEPNAAVHVVLILNMVIGATGMLLLARQLGLGWIAAVGGALVLELGDPMAQLTGWSPMQNGPWAWLPWTLLLCERLLRAPRRRDVAALAVVLTLELLPGWVLITALTYQLIALRVAWELLTVRAPRPWRAALAVAVGLALAPALAAVQLLPAAELARESFRVAVEVGEFLKYGSFMTDVVSGLRNRMPPAPLMMGPLLMTGLALTAPAHRRLALFYLLIGALYAVLALGNATPLFALYAKLPPGAATIRYANRLFWISGFSLAMLTAVGLDAVTGRRARAASGWLLPAIAAIAAALLLAAAPGRPRWAEVVALAAMVAALGAAALRPALIRPAAWVVVGALVLDLVAVPLRYPGRLLASVDSYWRHAGTLAAVEPPLSPQERVFFSSGLSSYGDFALMQKTATVLRLPDIHDYEALLGRRHTEYITMLWHGAPINGLDDLFGKHLVMGGLRPRLLDLAAVRYVIAPPSGGGLSNWGLDLPRVPLGDAKLLVYRNDAALPRARWVPRIEVVPDPSVLLNRLAYADDDLSAVAFVDAPLPSGFTGGANAPQAGSVRFVSDDPEHLVLDVDAPAAGFLVLADQYYPGWRATVNGAGVPIHRANYMFRLIEVPAGRSRVEFRYRPTSVAAGALVSLLGLAVVVGVFWSDRPRRPA